MEIKKFIDIHVPIFYCNLKCGYCYVSQLPQTRVRTCFNYSPEVVKKALSQERLGGICHFNVCGMGETLIPEQLVDYIRVILENGHTVMIVTNGTLTKRFESFMEFPADLKLRLGFKFSLHYLELKNRNMLDIFWSNVQLVKDNGCSFSVEMTANDSYEPYIDEIKQNCMNNVGAYCHVSVPRDEATRGIKLLTRHTMKEFYDIWKVFDSPMFEFKMRHWEERRREFCCAGLWTGLLNIGTGEYNSCYGQPGPVGNMFENIEEKFDFKAVGKCEIPHCFNGHSFLTWGVIPEINEERYLDIRDRVDVSGNHWVNDTMRSQFKSKLFECNVPLSEEEKKKIRVSHSIDKSRYIVKRIENKLRKGISKLGR